MIYCSRVKNGIVNTGRYRKLFLEVITWPRDRGNYSGHEPLTFDGKTMSWKLLETIPSDALRSIVNMKRTFIISLDPMGQEIASFNFDPLQYVSLCEVRSRVIRRRYRPKYRQGSYPMHRDCSRQELLPKMVPSREPITVEEIPNYSHIFKVS